MHDARRSLPRERLELCELVRVEAVYLDVVFKVVEQPAKLLAEL